jgi:hypothetical protein
MNVSIPRELRELVRQAAISTAAVERRSVDDSAWIVRAVAEKLLREWDRLGLGAAVPETVRRLAATALPRPIELPRAGTVENGAEAI